MARVTPRAELALPQLAAHNRGINMTGGFEVAAARMRQPFKELAVTQINPAQVGEIFYQFDDGLSRRCAVFLAHDILTRSAFRKL